MARHAIDLGIIETVGRQLVVRREPLENRGTLEDQIRLFSSMARSRNKHLREHGRAQCKTGTQLAEHGHWLPSHAQSHAPGCTTLRSHPVQRGSAFPAKHRHEHFAIIASDNIARSFDISQRGRLRRRPRFTAVAFWTCRSGRTYRSGSSSGTRFALGTGSTRLTALAICSRGTRRPDLTPDTLRTRRTLQSGLALRTRRTGRPRRTLGGRQVLADPPHLAVRQVPAARRRLAWGLRNILPKGARPTVRSGR